MAEGDRAFSGVGSVSLSGTYTLTADLGDVPDRFAISKQYSITNGTGVNTADRMFRDSRTFTSPANDNLDLSGGGLLDVYGKAFTLVELCYLAIFNTGSTAILVGGAGTNPIAGLFAATNDIISVPAGGCFVYTNFNDPAVAIANGSADVLGIANASGVSAYDIVILGRSA